MGVTYGSKVVKNDFSKVVPRPIGVLKPMFYGHFEPFWTYVSPCKLKKGLKMGNFGIDSATQEGLRGR